MVCGLLIFPSLAGVAQLARASACHAEGRGFESLQPLTFKGAVGTALNRRQARNSPVTTRALTGAAGSRVLT